MSTERVWLVSGASGFIGRHLCAAIHARGERAIALTRNARRAARCLGDTARPVERLETVEEPVDTVVNLAGEPLVSGRWTEKRKQRFLDSRLATTERLVRWLKGLESPPATLISGSAVGFYGSQGSKLLDETSEPQLGFSHKLCRRWEDEALLAQDAGQRVCLLRTGIVLGRDGGTLKAMLPPFRFGLGGRLGSGEQWMSWIHIEDIVRLILFLADHPPLAGPFNATAPHPVTNADFSRTLAATLRRPLLMPVPAWLLRAATGDLADELLLASQRVLPVNAREAGFEFHYPELAGALGNILKK